MQTAPKKLCVLLLAASLLAGLTACSREHYKQSADREVYGILHNKAPRVPGMPECYQVEQPEQKDPLADCPPADKEGLVAPIEEAPPPEPETEQPPAPVVIGLDKALAIATINSRDYQTQKESLFLSALALTLERYRFDPQFFGILSGEYDNTDLGDTTEATGESEFGFTWLFNTGAELSVSVASSLSEFLRGRPRRAASSLFSATITQPLLQGAGVAVTEPLTQAERDVLYALRSFVRFRRTFFVRVLDDYFRVLQQRQILENNRVNYENLQFLRKRSEALSKAGRLAEFQVDQIRQDELRAENDVVTARQVYQNQLDRFKVTLGLPTSARLVLNADELDRLSGESIPDVDLATQKLVSIAVEQRLDLKTESDRVDDAHRKVEVAANDLLPGLDLSAGISSETEGDSSPLNFQADNTDFTAGIELDLPLDKLAERNTFRRELIDLARARRDYEEFRDEVVRQVRDAWRQYERARRSYNIQLASVELAQRRVDSTELLLEAGRANARDVLESREALLRTQNALARVLVDYRLASLELARDMGILKVGEEGKLREEFEAYE